MDEKKLNIVHYSGLCKAIIQEVNKIDNNWRNGNFKKKINKCYDELHNMNYTYDNFGRI